MSHMHHASTIMAGINPVGQVESHSFTSIEVFIKTDADSTARLRFRNDGVLLLTRVIGSSESGPTPAIGSQEWLSAGNTPADYDVRVTETSGTFATGTVGTWLNLGTTRDWTQTRNFGTSGIGTTSVTYQVEIRDASTLEVLSDTTGWVLAAQID